jgi:REP element-mobilizing transposase RayT
MATVLKGIECPAILINGVEDHIHILCNLSRKCAIKDLIEEAKTETSKWIKTKGRTYAKFHWQAGYGAFSVSRVPRAVPWVGLAPPLRG